jgi:hypothetical protein
VRTLYQYTEINNDTKLKAGHNVSVIQSYTPGYLIHLVFKPYQCCCSVITFLCLKIIRLFVNISIASRKFKFLNIAHTLYFILLFVCVFFFVCLFVVVFSFPNYMYVTHCLLQYDFFEETALDESQFKVKTSLLYHVIICRSVISYPLV